jgi:hypothetical protein
MGSLRRLHLPASIPLVAKVRFGALAIFGDLGFAFADFGSPTISLSRWLLKYLDITHRQVKTCNGLIATFRPLRARFLVHILAGKYDGGNCEL